MKPSIEIHNVSKRYGAHPALDSVSFQVKEGALFGLIGPDGAGKTTLIRILATLLLADSGKAGLLGLDVVADYRKIRKQIGYMPGRFSLYADLTVEENLAFFASIFGTTIATNYDLIKDIYVQIEPFRKRKAGKLSGGMKQKLALCCALIHYPKVLLLDEPTTGVDPVSRKEFWQMLRRLQERGITILVSTPYMDEAGMCEEVALIQKGSILQVDTPQEITRQYAHPLFALGTDDQYDALLKIRAQEWVHTIYPFGQSLHLALKEPFTLPALQEKLNSLGLAEMEATQIQPGIEDCFMELMGR